MRVKLSHILSKPMGISNPPLYLNKNQVIIGSILTITYFYSTIIVGRRKETTDASRIGS